MIEASGVTVASQKGEGAVVAKNSRRFYCGYYVYPKEQA
jgi:hypothetical protein